MTWAYSFDHDHGLEPAELTALLGGKGANLAIMTSELGLPVPPGFTITTEACRAYHADGWPEGLDEELRVQMARIEAAVGRRFGDPADPLLVSVRSGAPVSMPGMLDTILNLGLNDETTPGLGASAGDDGFALACRERLTAMFTEIVGVDEVPQDPWRQLRLSVEAVFRSWHSQRAVSYRQVEGIPEDSGTAVTVQAMVFGNRGRDSATGVLFTRNPATGENVLYGDVLFGAQGEDVVAGTHATEPISVLDERLPQVAVELRSYADRLEQHNRDICDIEFTIEDGRLWMLQNRIGKRTAQAACRAAVEMAEDESFPLSRPEAVERVADILVDPPTTAAEKSDGVEVVARGLGASPGLATGAIATTPEKAVEMAGSGTDVLLVRSETSPDDVHGMAKAVGILTSSGGLASHAAVVARGWDIPAVVGATGVVVGEGGVAIADVLYEEGSVLSIDGSTGEVYGGAVDSMVTVCPEAATLLAWAQELGIEIGSAEEGSEVSAADTHREGAAVSTEDVVRVLAIKGFAMADMLGLALGVSADDAASLVERLAADGIVKDAGGMFSLTDDGKALGTEMIAADREAWGVDNAAAALDTFIELDGTMKEIVTAWQMREVDGEQVINDHTDTGYDAAVLSRLGELHAQATAFLTPLYEGLPRLAAYGKRLDAAAAAAAGGDGMYIASPRVDSYHGVWFELHEDLIRLAGKTREEEVAAGRA
jgi:pyruvate,orthophosphate dikinase